MLKTTTLYTNEVQLKNLSDIAIGKKIDMLPPGYSSKQKYMLLDEEDLIIHFCSTSTASREEANQLICELCQQMIDKCQEIMAKLQ